MSALPQQAVDILFKSGKIEAVGLHPDKTRRIRKSCRAEEDAKAPEPAPGQEEEMGTPKKRIGFVVGNYHTDHPSRLVHTIWDLLRDEDVELQVFLGTESASFMKDFAMRSNQYDYQYASLCGYTGYEELDLLIISAGTLSIYQNQIPLQEFLKHTADIPKILMETDYESGGGISMIADNTQGIASCVEHLITVHGMTRIGFITGPDNNKDAEERFAGYTETLKRHGIAFREEYVVHGDYSEHVDERVEELLDRVPNLEAIVSSNDEMTVSVYRVCSKRGLTVGKDIAVTGFDDMLMARYMDPPLTTSKQDYDEFSRSAVECALKMLRGEKVQSKRIPTPFIRRCSCGCAQETVPQESEEIHGQDDLIRSMVRSREYQHYSWIGSLMNREMLLEVGESKRFYAAIGSFMAYLGTSSSYLCLFEHPVRVEQGRIADFPEKIYVCMRQEGQDYAGYDWDEAPVLYRNIHNDMMEFRADGSYMTFLLFDESYQYGVLNAAIEPEMIDFYYMLALDIGTNLCYMDLWAQQKQYREELQAMAQTDALTGLLNRAGVIQERAQMLGRKTRRAGVIMADLDHLKQINDQFGHHEGDFALTTVADILRQAAAGEEESPDSSCEQKQDNAKQDSAKQDSAKPDETKKDGVKQDNTKQDSANRIIGRIGGDEFILCGVNVTKEELQEYVDRVHALCDQFNAASDKPYYVEISAGIAMGRVRDMEDWTKLSDRADAELYEAKKTRREFVIRS